MTDARSSDASPAGAHSSGVRPTDAELRDQLVGTYRVVAVESVDEDGDVRQPFGEDPAGYIAYTPEGYMMAILSRRDRPRFADGDIMGGSEPERAQAFLEASAFVGRFEVRDGRVAHYLDVATFQNWVGTAQVRDFEVTDGGLVLRTPFLLMDGKPRSSVVRLVRTSPSESDVTQ